MIAEGDEGLEVGVLPFAVGDLRRVRPCAAGQLLQTARLAARLSIEAVGAMTRIRPCYLEALEAGQLDGFAAPIYAIGFARNYARAVGLDPERIEQEMRAYIAGTSTAWRRSGWLS